MNSTLGFGGKSRTSRLESVRDRGWSRSEQILDCLTLLTFLIRVLGEEFVLERLSKDFGELSSCRTGISREDHGWLSKNKVTEELILRLGLLDVVSDWK